ncbi:MAG: Uma2 family endonuclease [Isosphaera sp.]|nr:Uma2 family endonuclease [Isosphaera sp.]
MTPATITPPPVQPVASVAPPAAGPQPHRWTIAEYRELGKTGLFSDKKTMLLDGVLYVMTLPNPPHDLSLGLADDWLRAVFATGHHVRNQMGFDIGNATDPGPDLAVVAGARRDYVGRTPTTAVLLVEVADSSLLTDTTKKAEWYATAGVPEYWVIDVVNRQLHVFRGPVPLPAGLGATAYRTHLTLSPADTVVPLAAPHATVTVADLLP